MHEFLEPVDPSAAVRAVRSVVARVRRIPRAPRLGERVPGFGEREVRRVLVQKYEIRYELADADVTVLRVFHTREER
ncbi:MAG: type II toxin-antitoxin system RelE/ParE family toxin [Steroidobacteraceae bacterium]|nr:type II toxin-antitoxin system RelE/ParE family toxin [Steroidobacteraceae bacterium]